MRNNKKSGKGNLFAGGIGGQYHHHNILRSIEHISDIKYILAVQGLNRILKN